MSIKYAVQRSPSPHSYCQGEDNKTEADILKQKCDKWRGEAVQGAGEQRDIAVERINQCLNEPTKKPNLNLKDLKLTSLPPLPSCEKLFVSEELLEQLLSLAVGNNSSDKITEQAVENFLDYHFTDVFDDVSREDFTDFIREDIFDHYKLGDYGSEWRDFYKEVIECFNSRLNAVDREAKEYLAENLKKFSEKRDFSVDKLKSELEKFVRDKLYDISHIYVKEYCDRHENNSDSDD
ncbi:hypothetical protein [Enterobacter sp. 22466]|uniref:hypothetical protein n=1 Tax=Enterobacter sp. 22466 TaxID=3453924 RepID=UPI003F83FB06